MPAGPSWSPVSRAARDCRRRRYAAPPTVSARRNPTGCETNLQVAGICLGSSECPGTCRRLAGPPARWDQARTGSGCMEPWPRQRRGTVATVAAGNRGSGRCVQGPDDLRALLEVPGDAGQQRARPERVERQAGDQPDDAGGRQDGYDGSAWPAPRSLGPGHAGTGGRGTVAAAAASDPCRRDRGGLRC
jgi:hypothetical protein